MIKDFPSTIKKWNKGAIGTAATQSKTYYNEDVVNPLVEALRKVRGECFDDSDFGEIIDKTLLDFTDCK